LAGVWLATLALTFTVVPIRLVPTAAAALSATWTPASTLTQTGDGAEVGGGNGGGGLGGVARSRDRRGQGGVHRGSGGRRHALLAAHRLVHPRCAGDGLVDEGAGGAHREGAEEPGATEGTYQAARNLEARRQRHHPPPFVVGLAPNARELLQDVALRGPGAGDLPLPLDRDRPVSPPRPARHGRRSRHRGPAPALRSPRSEIVRPIVPSSPTRPLASAPLVQTTGLHGCAVEALCWCC
jgi:hypothetical protein